MKQVWMLQRLEIKRMLLLLPRMLFGAAALSVVIAAVAFCGARLQEKDDTYSKMTVALVLGGDRYLQTVGVEILKNTESAGSLCEFEVVSQEEAEQGLAEGRYFGIITFPDQFVSSVQSGESVVASVVLPKFGNALNGKLIQMMAEAGASLLAATESGIYAGIDLYHAYDIQGEAYTKMVNDLNLLYAEHTLSREEVFDERTASGTEGATMVQYYLCAGSVLFLLLTCVAAGAVFSGDPKALRNQLAVNCVGAGWQVIAKIAALCLQLFVLYGGAFAVLAVWWKQAPQTVTDLFGVVEGSDLVRLFWLGIPVVLAVGCLAALLFSLAAGQIGGILLLFVVTLVMGYASGCLVPNAYLPAGIRAAGGWLPMSYMRRQLLAGLLGSETYTGILLLFCAAFVCLACAVTAAKDRLRARAGR